MRKNRRDNNSFAQDEKEAKIKELQLQIAANLWFQSFAQLIEAAAVTKLFYLDEQAPGGEEIVQGVWVQAIGQIIESIGVSEQLLSEDGPLHLRGMRTATTGDWLQSIGAAVEAAGGERVLRDAILKDGNGFVP